MRGWPNTSSCRPTDQGVNASHVETLRRDLGVSFQPDLDRLEKLKDVNDMKGPEYREAWLWVHLMLHSNPEAKTAPLTYLQDQRTGHNPGLLAARAWPPSSRRRKTPSRNTSNRSSCPSTPAQLHPRPPLNADKSRRRSVNTQRHRGTEKTIEWNRREIAGCREAWPEQFLFGFLLVLCVSVVSFFPGLHMNLLVTAGNTLVPIDRVRGITNIFTGRTGAVIARHAYERGHTVTLLTSHPETMDAPPPQRWTMLDYRTFEDLQNLMDEQVTKGGLDTVVHCAAVSDYLAGGIYSPAECTHFCPESGRWESAARTEPGLIDRAADKVKSDEPELWLRLVRAPKLIDRVRRDWGFRGLLVKFKLEVGVSDEQLLAVAERRGSTRRPISWWRTRWREPTLGRSSAPSTACISGWSAANWRSAC